MATRDPLSKVRIQKLIAAGQAVFEENRYEEAAVHFRAALQMKPLPAEDEAIIRCHLIEALDKRGLKSEVIKEISRYENSTEFARFSEQTQMNVLIRLGLAHSYGYNIPVAIALFNRAMRIARRFDDDKGIGECHFGLGRVYRFFSEIRIARDHYNSALEHFRRAGSWRDIAHCCYCIGNIDLRAGDYQNALEFNLQALAIISDYNEHYLFGRIYCDLASIYARTEISLGKAVEAWEKSIYHSRKSGNTLELAWSYNSYACGLRWLGEWDRAEQLLKLAIELLHEPIRFYYLSITLDSLAELYMLQGKLGKAVQFLEKSLMELSKVKNNKQIFTKEHPYDATREITVGRIFLTKGQLHQAIHRFERAVNISLQLEDRSYLSYSQLWLAEALLQKGQVEQARDMVESVRSDMRESPDMMMWGLMMRMVAKVESASGLTTSALYSLIQSSSYFESRGCVYDRAVNRIALARLLEQQGHINESISESESALTVFKSLGAAIDERNTRNYLKSLRSRLSNSRPNSRSSTAREQALPFAPRLQQPEPDPASILDGFIAHRLAQASVSRELLLHELASIIREKADSRAALVVRFDEDALKVAASVELDESEQANEIESLSGLPSQEYESNFVYPFNDNRGANFLLHVIEPKSERFKSGTINLRPMLSIVELGLEAQAQRNERRKVQAFDPARLLAQVEMPGFICASRAMSQVLERIHKIRSSDVTVLITGESGTGKELIARAVHAGSSRRFRAFLPFNCSSAPREMVESQLFGYRKGAFTGATEAYEGIIRSAERGTLFLDEIGDLPIDLQPKLLRFLQEGEIHPLGVSQPMRVDVRVIAATNSDLEQAITGGKFREDLYHRLNVIRIQVPPLRERREEIPALLNYYLDLYQQDAGKSDIEISEEAVDLMVVYDWPGNVRELCNEVRRIVAYNESGAIVTSEALSSEIARTVSKLSAAPPDAGKISESLAAPVAKQTLAEATNELERRMIQEALRRSSGNIAQAARDLGLTRRGLYMKMDRLKFNA